MADTITQMCGPRMFRTYMDRMTADGFQRLGISSAIAPYLGEIHHNPGISLKDLSDILMVDKAHTTRTVNRMMELGLVEDTAEGHRYSLRLTEKGENVAKEVKDLIDGAWKNLFKDLTEEEAETLKAIFSKVAKILREESQ